MLRMSIDAEMAAARKAHQMSKLKVLGLIKAEYQRYYTSGSNKVLDDATEVKILKKLQKQWKEELEAFINAGRDTFDLTLELKYLESYIPKELSEDEQKEIATKVIENYLKDLPVDERPSMKHLGAIMKIINKEYSGIEGKLVSELYKKLINI